MSCTCSSIFNDVLGPVMNGPSSSHSAGCARIGLVTRGLYGKPVLRADVVFEEQGSYPSTYIGQGSDFGFTGGLLGLSPEDPSLKDALGLARNGGADIRFKKADLGFKHPNQARIDVFDADGSAALSVMTYSIGGGMFRILEMDGFAVSIDGTYDQAFVECGEKDAVQRVEKRLADAGAAWEAQELHGRTLITVARPTDAVRRTAEGLREEPGVACVRFADAILPVPLKEKPAGELRCARDALRAAEETGRSLWELAIAYECGIGEVGEKDVWKLAAHVEHVMRESAKTFRQGSQPVEWMSSCRGAEMEERAKETAILDTSMLHRAMMAAVAVMENSCARNIVVAAPTAGSSGVIPGTVVTLGDEMKKTSEEIQKALLAAGLVGAFIANQATFGGEVGACQAENGSASAMAAAGLVQLMGGSVRQAFAAASLAMQNMLGLVCDPVGGRTEIPCIGRNVNAVFNAALSANMVLCGFDPVIPLDETILAMGEVGKQLPEALRCTCRGGLCTTATGRRLSEELNKKYKPL